MQTLAQIISVLLVLIAASLVFFVIYVFATEDDVRVGVAIAYVVAAILLTAAAVVVWRRASGPSQPPLR